MDTIKYLIKLKDWALSCFRANENFKLITALEQKPQPVSDKFNLFHRYLLWFVKQWFYYSVLRACNMYIDDHYQMATKNVLPFIRNSELCMCYKILFWPAIFQRFFPSSALGPVLRPSHRARANWLVSPPILSSALIGLRKLSLIAYQVPSQSIYNWQN